MELSGVAQYIVYTIIYEGIRLFHPFMSPVFMGLGITWDEMKKTELD